jgi:hypothetical protein
MTSAATITVRDLLPANLDQMDHVMQVELNKENTAGLPAYAWKLIGSGANDAVHDALDLDIFELLAQGWCIARELHEYTDPTRHPPAEKSTVFLGSHTLTTVLHPTIVVTVEGIKYPPLNLALALNADFRAAALSIQNGHITSLNSGDCAVSAQLKYADVNLHNPLQSRPVTLPGKLTFNTPGLAIQ